MVWSNCRHFFFSFQPINTAFFYGQYHPFPNVLPWHLCQKSINCFYESTSAPYFVLLYYLPILLAILYCLTYYRFVFAFLQSNSVRENIWGSSQGQIKDTKESEGSSSIQIYQEQLHTQTHTNIFEAFRKLPKQPEAKIQKEKKNIKVNHWHFTAAFLFKAFVYF